MNIATAPPLKRRTRLTTAEREQAILDAAMKFFSENGLAADTRGIAEKLGISQGLIFRYFPTKADLLERVFERILLPEWHPQWEMMLRDRTLPLRQRLIDFYSSFLEQTDSAEWLRIIMFASLSGSNITQRYYEDYFRSVLDVIAIELREEARSNSPGGPPTEHERETVFVLHGAVFYSLVRRYINRITPEPRSEKWVSHVVDVFLDGARDRTIKPHVDGKPGPTSVRRKKATSAR